MSQCKFVYDEYSDQVKKFKVKAGTQCKLEAIDERGYCHNHIVKTNLATPEEIKAYGKTKYKREMARREQERAKKSKELADNDNKIADRRLASIRDALTIKDFDLEEFYKFADQVGVGGFDAKYTREWCFAHWILADKETRIPETIDEVAEILGVKKKVLEDLSNDVRLERFLRKAREDMVLRRGEPAYLAWMLDGVEHGDKDAIKEFVKLREKRLANVKDEDAGFIDPDVLNEAEKINNGKHVPMDNKVADAVGWEEVDDPVTEDEL